MNEPENSHSPQFGEVGFCVRCGSQLPETDDFCPKCGSAPYRPLILEPEERYGMSSFAVFGMVAAGVLAIVLLLWFVKDASSGDAPGRTASSVLTHHEIRPVLSGSHVIAPREVSTVEFTVQPDMHNVRLHGRFEAQGGSGNDIRVALTDPDGYLNAQNGHEFRSFYSSGQVTADTLYVMLRPGTYDLIFDNRFSLLSNKAYTAEIVLEYDRSL